MIRFPCIGRFLPVLMLAILLCLTCLPAATVSAAETASGDALTRGSSFTVTVTGNPNTTYYIWLTRTFSMSGEPGDQPPVISGSTTGIEKDPPGGPYTIGSYAYYNGGGRTIRDDVAPSTAGMSNTEYYAQITTDGDGRAVVQFKTSINTATRTYSVKVENPQNPNDGATVIKETLYPRKAPSVYVETSPPPTHTALPVTTFPEPVVKVTAPSQSTVPLTSTVPSPPPTTTPRAAASPCVLAAGAGAVVLLLRRYAAGP